MKTYVIDWHKRRIEMHYKGALFIRKFDHMIAANRRRVAKEIKKLTESGYRPTKQPDKPWVWVYTKGATL